MHPTRGEAATTIKKKGSYSRTRYILTPIPSIRSKPDLQASAAVGALDLPFFLLLFSLATAVDGVAVRTPNWSLPALSHFHSQSGRPSFARIRPRPSSKMSLLLALPSLSPSSILALEYRSGATLPSLCSRFHTSFYESISSPPAMPAAPVPRITTRSSSFCFRANLQQYIGAGRQAHPLKTSHAKPFLWPGSIENY